MTTAAHQQGPRPWRRRPTAALATLQSRRLRPMIIAAMLTVGIALHYGDLLPLLSTLADRSPVGVTTRQGLERVLFLLPVMYAAFAFGVRGGAITVAIVAAVLFPRAIVSSLTVDHAVPETAAITAVGALLVVAITQQRREVDTQIRMRYSLGHYIRQILTAQEDERRRIALELHDETTQDLLLTCQRLDQLTSGRSGRLPREVEGELQSLRAATNQTIRDLRRLSQNLRPRILDDQGLVPALGWLTDYVADQYGIKARLEVENAPPQLSQERQLLLFRIAQEALHNVGQHSHASETTVSLRSHAGAVTMAVVDNGRGFEPPKALGDLAIQGKLGVLGMHERARLLGGTLEIRSEVGRGTTMVVQLPAGTADRPAAGGASPEPGSRDGLSLSPTH